jgi:hypothetical protein
MDAKSWAVANDLDQSATIACRSPQTGEASKTTKRRSRFQVFNRPTVIVRLIIPHCGIPASNPGPATNFAPQPCGAVLCPEFAARVAFKLEKRLKRQNGVVVFWFFYRPPRIVRLIIRMQGAGSNPGIRDPADRHFSPSYSRRPNRVWLEIRVTGRNRD